MKTLAIWGIVLFLGGFGLGVVATVRYDANKVDKIQADLASEAERAEKSAAYNQFYAVFGSKPDGAVKTQLAVESWVEDLLADVQVKREDLQDYRSRRPGDKEGIQAMQEDLDVAAVRYGFANTFAVNTAYGRTAPALSLTGP